MYPYLVLLLGGILNLSNLPLIFIIRCNVINVFRAKLDVSCLPFVFTKEQLSSPSAHSTMCLDCKIHQLLARKAPRKPLRALTGQVYL